MSKGFDVIGSKEKAVAIVEIGQVGEASDKDIAEEIMRKNKNVKSVLKKESDREGEHRTRKYKLIAGNKNTEVLHKEHGYSLRIDPQKVYFSVREGTERQRIAKRVKAGEFVIVMFAGIGPYAIAIAKKQSDVEKVVAVEINPDAVEYMKHNVRINKLSHKIVPVLGDVRKVCEKWYGKCDRIVMPLPLGAGNFLDVAVMCAKGGATVYLYGWGNKADGDIYAALEKTIKTVLKKLSLSYKITDRWVVLPYAPGKFKVCIEFKIL